MANGALSVASAAGEASLDIFIRLDGAVIPWGKSFAIFAGQFPGAYTVARLVAISRYGASPFGRIM